MDQRRIQQGALHHSGCLTKGCLANGCLTKGRLTNWRQWWSAKVVALALALTAVAAGAAPVAQIEHSQQSLYLSRHIDVLADPGGELSIADVRTETLRNRFAPLALAEASATLSFAQQVYWLRFTVVNQAPTVDTLYLELYPPSIDFVDLYAFHPGADTPLLHRRAGLARPASDADVRKSNVIFALPAEYNRPIHYYLRLESRKTLSLTLLMSTPSAFLSHNSQSNWWLGSLFGAATVIGLGMLIMAWQYRDPAFLWFVVYLGAFTLLQGQWHGYFHEVLPEAGWLQDGVLSLLVFAVIAGATQFARTFLSTRQRLPLWDWVLLALVLLALAGMVAALTAPPAWYLSLDAALTLSSTLLLFAVAAVAFWQRLPGGQYYLVSRLVVTAPAIMMLAIVNGVVEWDYWVAQRLIMLAVILEAIILGHAMVTLRQFRERERSQREALNQLQESRQLQQQRVQSSIRHEVRTLISGVIGMAELLLDSSLSQNQRDHALTIRRSGEALLTWLNRLGDWTALSTGKLRLQALPFDLPNLVKEFVEDSREQASGASLAIHLELDPRLPPLVEGDPERIKQMLSGMLHHARQFSREQQFRLHVQPLPGKARWRFQLCDEHSNLTQQDIDSVFSDAGDHQEPYQQDLLITRQLAVLMGGDLSIEPGTPLCYRCDVTLPRHTLLDHSEADYDSLLRNKRLLVVDDNPTSRKLLAKQAERWSMRVSTAQTGTEALALLRNEHLLGEPFDLVVLDHQMPVMSGMDLARKIHEDPDLRQQLTLVMLSGATHAPSADLALNAGIRRVLTKPVNAKTLKITLAEELKLADARRTNATPPPETSPVG